MKTVGIVVEYNPLHNGHVLHYRKSKEVTGADAVVAVMSGPFLQRGEPAIASKRARAEMALAMGVDLCLELPVTYAVQPAEWFAYGAVAILEATGVVDCLSFGSESGTLEQILPLSRSLANESGELRSEIEKRLREGMNFPSAYGAAAAALFGESEPAIAHLQELLTQPNNSLGLHYLIALERLGSRITPYTIPRENAQYHDPLPGASSIASATAIRNIILSQGLEAARPYMPEFTHSIMEREIKSGRAPVHWEQFRQPLFQTLLTHTPAQLEGLLEVTEGLEHRVQRSLFQLEQPTVDALLEALKTKRYTRTKLQRMLLHIMLNHDKASMNREELAKGPGYIRVLGFSETGRSLLKRMKHSASLPVIHKPAKLEHPQLERDLMAAAVYANGQPRPDMRHYYGDYLLPPLTP
ncbi:nucleotidyltransferase [Paenibacillus sp. Dod16]|uniref:nucleotidyltransferase n=1 Tax=Paenibacillus sp. Dod16 TaxID=3416392 RepID=UPI003CF86063